MSRSVYSSPGVYVRERDLSGVVPSLSSTIASIVGYSPKGDITNIRLITSQQQFIEEYGTPVLGEYFHYSALAFLEKGNTLYCKRVVNGALFGGLWIIKDGGVGSNQALSIGVATPGYEEVSNEDILFYIYAKDPGEWNDNIAITIENTVASDYTFDIVVWSKDTDGNYTEEERWKVSRKYQVDGYGRQQYLEDAINDFSAFIVVYDNTDEADTVLPEEQTTVLDMNGGFNGSAVSDAQINTAWDEFADPEKIDLRMLINAGYTSPTVQTKLKTIAEARKDCLAILDVPYSVLTSVSAIVNWRDSVQNLNSSFIALYAPWAKIYDQWNDKTVEVPVSGYVASQFAYNDYVADPWYAAAGFTRGVLNILGLTNVFTKGERDVLYAAQINPLQMFSGEGSAIWGNKTQQVKETALSRVNVRRLLITIEKAVSVAMRSYLFEPNSELTRARIKALLDQYMNLLSARGAFQTEIGDKGYRVVCDTTNNTPAIIDANQLNVDIYIKPSRAAEVIQVSAIITNTGTSFAETIARNITI